jgi:hypothetical protein
MATDYAKLVENLLSFYNFTDKTVIAVGAGGGQLIGYGRAAGHVLALDNDAAALEKLRERLKTAGLEDRFTLVLDDFYKSSLKADAVLFEFCLHEMPDPAAAVEHARGMARDVIVFDHWPGSEWSFAAAEDQKVAAAWASLVRFPVKKKQMYEAVQAFQDYDELYEKVKGQGETAISRIAPYKGRTGIRLPMAYGLALI